MRIRAYHGRSVEVVDLVDGIALVIHEKFGTPTEIRMSPAAVAKLADALYGDTRPPAAPTAPSDLNGSVPYSGAVTLVNTEEP